MKTKTRLLTAAVGVPYIIFVLVVRGWFAELMVVLFSLAALREYYLALNAAGYRVCTWGGYLSAVAMWPLSRMMGVLDPLMLVMAATGISLLGVMLSPTPTFPDAAASVYPLFTCLLPMSLFMLMLNATFDTVPGIALITMAFAIAYCCDASAYFGGKALGKHKLCPQVSPKKTVEGAVFGVAGAVVGAQLCRLVFVHIFHMSMPGFIATTVLGVIGSIAGQLGDLTASLLKRHSGIKDFGKIFPGHGGVMDRFDSTIFVMCVLYCYASML